MKKNLANRRSGIELLKIIAIFMIVVYHVTQTLSSVNINYVSDYVINVKQATTSIQQLVLSFFSFAGAQGNFIFFTCSAWFLLESKKTNAKKIFAILADVWVISVIFLVGIGVIGGYSVTFKEILQSLLPSTFANNWYITAYILFYAIHVGLNWIIEKLTQKQLLSSCIIMGSLYFGLNYVMGGGLLFATHMVTFIVIYFVVAYVKLYMPDFCQSVWKNITVFLIGIFSMCILTLFTNYLGLHINIFADKVTHWGGNSPFLLMIAISLFNLFNKIDFRNKWINEISGLSLLVYIIHENLLFRTYVRPQIWTYIYHSFGYENVVLWDLLYAGALFVLSILAATIYKILIQKWLYKITNTVSDKIIKLYSALCDRLIKAG